MISKVNDICQGYCAACESWMSGRIITGSNNVFTNGLPTSNLHCIVQGSCGHIGFLIGTTKNRVNSLPIGMIGSPFVGTFSGSVITGSSNVRSI